MKTMIAKFVSETPVFLVGFACTVVLVILVFVFVMLGALFEGFPLHPERRRDAWIKAAITLAALPFAIYGIGLLATALWGAP